MKITVDGKRYDTEKMRVIADRDHFSNGNYAGCWKLLRASDGQYFMQRISNGQDIYFVNGLTPLGYDEAVQELDGMDMTDEQEAYALEIELITTVE